MRTIEPTHLPPHQIPAIYKQVGASSMAIDEGHAESRLPVRANLRHATGPSAAALAVLLQDLSAVTIARFAPLVVPIQINVRIRSTAARVTDILAHGTTLRRGRQVQFTEALYCDAVDPEVVVAYATGSWATMNSNLDEPRPTRFGPGTTMDADADGIRDFSDLLDAVGGSITADRTGVELGAVDPATTEPIALGGTETGTLHAGAMQVLAESAAWIAAESEAARPSLRIEELSTQFLAPARLTPLCARGRVVARTDGSVDCRVEIREANERLVALSYARFDTTAG